MDAAPMTDGPAFRTVFQVAIDFWATTNFIGCLDFVAWIGVRVYKLEWFFSSVQNDEEKKAKIQFIYLF